VSAKTVAVAKSGHVDGVLVDNGLAEGVGDEGAGSHGEGALAGVVGLDIEGGGTEDGGHLVDGSLQVTVVSSDGLVASDSNGDGGVGGNNVGLNGGGVGLVGDLVGGGDNGGGQGKAGVAKMAKSGVSEVAKAVSVSGEGVGSGDNRGGNLLSSLPLAVEVSAKTVAVAKSGHVDGVLVDNGLAEGVGDEGAGSHGEGALAGVVGLDIEGGGTEDGGHLVDGSLQVTVVSSDGLVASDSDGDGQVGGLDLSLDGGGVGLVGDLMGGRHHGVGQGEAVAEVTGVGETAKVLGGGVGLGSHCQQEGSEDLHCSSVVFP